MRIYAVAAQVVGKKHKSSKISVKGEDKVGYINVTVTAHTGKKHDVVMTVEAAKQLEASLPEVMDTNRHT